MNECDGECGRSIVTMKECGNVSESECESMIVNMSVIVNEIM